MKLVSFLFRYSRMIAIVSVVIGLISGACSAGLVAAVHATLNATSSGKTELLVRFAALALAVPVLRFCSSLLLTSLSQRGTYDLRKRLSQQIATAPLRRLEEVGSHRIMTALTEDIFVITNTLIRVPVLCMQLAVVIGCLVYLAILSWTVLATVLIFMALGALSFRLTVNRAIRYYEKARDYSDTLMGHFRALTDGAKELKLHRKRREVFISEVMEEAAQGLRSNNVAGTNIMAVSSGFTQVFFFALIGLLLFGLPAVQQFDERLLTGCVLAVFYLLIPFEDLVNLIPALARANIAMGRIESLGLSLKEVVSEGDTTSSGKTVGWGNVCLEGVTHTYRGEDDSTFALGPIHLTIYPGEIVFLVGGNGSGKTTLAKLLTGLYAPENGLICLNDEPVTDENRDEYRQLFSVVFSDFYLFEALIGLDTDKLDERARGYLVQLKLDHKVEVKNGVLSTIRLSQGQRKRLGLLTAFLEDRPFYLFDEWAADQDPVFREIFYLNLLPELKARGKTVVVISHDDRYYHLGDRIIKLDYGKIEYDSRLTASDVGSVEIAESAVLL
jgi:putative ATP-binding cassette transporter